MDKKFEIIQREIADSDLKRKRDSLTDEIIAGIKDLKTGIIKIQTSMTTANRIRKELKEIGYKAVVKKANDGVEILFKKE